MITLNVEQRSEEWLNARRGVITGTAAKTIKPLSRKGKTGNQPMGFWELAAEIVSVEENGGVETALDRGTRLENENAEICVQKMNLQNPKYDCGIWLTDDRRLGYSPDAAEDAELPKWAIECKSLKTAEHLYLAVKDLFAIGQLPDEFETLFPARVGEYRGIDSVAEEHQYQVRQAFVVNPELEVLYYSLYDPRIVETGALAKIRHHVIIVRREEMGEDVSGQKEMVETQALAVRKLVKALLRMEI